MSVFGPFAWADATWTGAGDGINWSDPTNWSGDPTTGGSIGLKTGNSTVDVDAAAWGIAKISLEQGNGDTSPHVLTINNNVTTNSEFVLGNDDRVYQTAGDVTIGSQIRYINNKDNSYEISGGSLSIGNKILFYASNEANPSLFHVNGSGPTSIEASFLDFQNRSQAFTTFQFSLDAGGVCPISLTDTGNNIRNYAVDAKLDLSNIADYDVLTNGLSVPLFTFASGFESDVFDSFNITIGELPFGAASASVVQWTGTGITLEFEAAAISQVIAVANGNWNTPGTWDTNWAPFAGDLVTVDGETVNVALPGTAAKLTVTAGRVDVESTLDIVEGLTVSGGTLHIGPDGVATAGYAAAGGGTISIGSGGVLNAGRLDSGIITLADGGTLQMANIASSGLASEAGAHLSVSEQLTVDSLLDLSAGTLTVTGATVELATGGILQMTNGWSTTALDLLASGGSLNLGGNGLTLTDSLAVTGSLDLSTELLSVANTLSVTGGTLTVGNAVTPDTLVLNVNAAIAGAGSVIPTTLLELNGSSVAGDLSGGYRVEITGGIVQLSGNNSYAGLTTVINGATLKVGDLNTNVGAGLLEINVGSLATSGTIERTIGLDDGQIFFAGNFGFTADGADLTVTLARNDGLDLPLEWNDPLSGFNAQTMLVDKLGDHTVEITNDIDLQGNKTVDFQNNNGSAEVDLKLSGNLTGSQFQVRSHRAGWDYNVVWLAGSDLSGLATVRLWSGGILRMVDEETGLSNLPANPAFAELYFGQIETNGTYEMRGTSDLGNSTPGYVCFNNWGGISAYGGDLTFEMKGAFDDDPWNLSDEAYTHFFGATLNSPYSDAVVTFKGDVVNGFDNEMNNWGIRIYNNPNTDADYARLEGNWSMETMFINGINQDFSRGGIVKLVEGYTLTTDSSQGEAGTFTVQASADFRVNGTLDVSGGSNVIVNGTGKLGGNGTVKLGFYNVDIAAGSTIAPGDGGVGTLTIDGGQLLLNEGAIYEWEIGQAGDDQMADLIAIDGDLSLAGFVTVKVLDGGGNIDDFADKRDLFSYTGPWFVDPFMLTADYADLLAGPGGWEIDPAGVLFGMEDRAGVHYITITGLRGGVSEAFAWLGGEGDWANGEKWDAAETPNASVRVVVHVADSIVHVTTPDATAASLTISDGEVAVAAGGTLTTDIVESSGTLSGSGTIVADVSQTGGQIAPGDGVGTLTVDGDLVLADGVVYVCQLKGDQSDSLTVTENLILGNGTSQVEFEIDGKFPFKAGQYTLVTVEGEDRGGTFAIPTGLGDYVDVTTGGLDYPTASNTVTLTIDYDLHDGDADLNTVTDVRDFNVWNTNKFTTGTDWASGDFDGNGVTDVRDFNVWNTAKFTSVAGAAPVTGGQVPEPGTLALLICGVLGLLAVRRKVRTRVAGD